MKTRIVVMGLAVAGAAMLGGCAVYPTPYGPAVAPAPVYAPPAVVVSPSVGYYGGGYYGRGYYGRGYYGRRGYYGHW